MSKNSDDGRKDGMADNKVGYRRPPKHSRFKPGQSGNPKGRTRGKKNVGSIFEQLLSERVVVRQGNTQKRMSKIEAMLRGVFNNAMQGDSKAWKTLIDLAQKYGHFDTLRATQKITVGFVNVDRPSDP